MKNFFVKRIKPLTVLILIFILMISSFSIVLAGPEDEDMPIERGSGKSYETELLEYKTDIRK